MFCKIVFCPKFPDIPDNVDRVARRRRRTQAIPKRYVFHIKVQIKNTFFKKDRKVEVKLLVATCFDDHT